MEIKLKSNLRKFQVGGAIDAPAEEGMLTDGAPIDEGTPAAPELQDPMVQLAQLFAQGLQNQDCSLLAQGALMFLELLQLAQGGGAPAEPDTEPVFRKGGSLVRRIKK